MTPDELHLLRQIVLNPREDSVRLAYADCIQEERNDEARAAFIRTQIAIAGIKPRPVYETMDWATRTVTYYRFPGVTFKLPPHIAGLSPNEGFDIITPESGGDAADSWYASQ